MVIMVPVTMDITVTGRGFPVTGVVDGLTMAGEEVGMGDIGDITIKGSMSVSV